MSLLFCIQLLITDVVVVDPTSRQSLEHLYFGFFCAALGIICVGAIKLVRVEGVGSRWRKRARACVVTSVLLLYFSPFLYWWKALPENSYYTLNLFAMILAVVAFLSALNLLCIELGHFTGDRSLVAESRVFLGLTAFVLALPAAWAFGFAAMRSLQADSSENLGLEFVNLFRLHATLRLGLFIILFLPISLTLANLWRVKEMLLDELKKFTAA